MIQSLLISLTLCSPLLSTRSLIQLFHLLGMLFLEFEMAGSSLPLSLGLNTSSSEKMLSDYSIWNNSVILHPFIFIIENLPLFIFSCIFSVPPEEYISFIQRWILSDCPLLDSQCLEKDLEEWINEWLDQ